MAEKIKPRFPEGVQRTLVSAGWFPGRQIDEQVDHWQTQLVSEGGFELFPAARSALTEFGALHFSGSGAGVDCAIEPVSLDPSLAIGEEDRFKGFEKQLAVKLFPLGEAVGGHVFLAIGDDGRVFTIMESAWLVGENIDDALIRLLEGRKVQPM